MTPPDGVDTASIYRSTMLPWFGKILTVDSFTFKTNVLHQNKVHEGRGLCTTCP